MNQTLLPRRSFLCFMICFSLLVIVGGAFGVIRSGALGYVAVTGGVILLAWSVLTALPGSTYIRVGPQGFTACSLYHQSFVPWSSVTEFAVFTVNHAFGLSPWKSRLVTFTRLPAGSNAPQRDYIHRGPGGRCILPASIGTTASDVAAYMNACLAQTRIADRT